jgi:RNA polymerase sigma factor (sigma-70 family)
VGTSDELDRRTAAALAELYESRYHRLLRVVEAIVGDPELAQDTVQEAFARVLRSRRAFRGEGSLEGWVWRTVINTARNARRDRRPAHAELADIVERPATANGDVPDERLRVLIAGLPERQRLVLFLRYYADLEYEQIAAALEIKPGTVGATLTHAHNALGRLLQEVSP